MGGRAENASANCPAHPVPKTSVGGVLIVYAKFVDGAAVEGAIIDDAGNVNEIIRIVIALVEESQVVDIAGDLEVAQGGGGEVEVGGVGVAKGVGLKEEKLDAGGVNLADLGELDFFDGAASIFGGGNGGAGAGKGESAEGTIKDDLIEVQAGIGIGAESEDDLGGGSCVQEAEIEEVDDGSVGLLVDGEFGPAGAGEVQLKLSAVDVDEVEWGVGIGEDEGFLEFASKRNYQIIITAGLLDGRDGDGVVAGGEVFEGLLQDVDGGGGEWPGSAGAVDGDAHLGQFGNGGEGFGEVGGFEGIAEVEHDIIEDL